ncbi:unnamed protein product [Rotaria magnacalcarata]|uniref:B box-type domain-containing protein n=2 Tax=Rotaria magnacalcarata TaxID=392030 RepID=A0A814S4V6_9BILA|nr:unnamed protein product [Rotaria magnacalcarata]CAF3835362.1 unnamed protein product [Rotaria magnacalcarata]
MASGCINSTCVACNEGLVTAICYECKQAFCTKHFAEHRQQFSQQMNNISQEHDILCRDLTRELSTMHPLLAQINQWEQKSILKIQTAANAARIKLQQLLDRSKSSLETSVSKLTEELQSSRASNNYTERDIKKWSDQLHEFRTLLNNPTPIYIDYENNLESTIRLVKVTDESLTGYLDRTSHRHEINNECSHNPNFFFRETFGDVFGKIVLSERNRIATCLGDYLDRSCVSCLGRYSSGRYAIRFRIENADMTHYMFFGVVNSSEKLMKDLANSTSFYGWWDLAYYVVGGNKKKYDSTKTLRKGDELTFVVDCDNKQIILEHHRTNIILNLAIDIQLCAFPWKIIVLLLDRNSCVEILH